jgi:hypothetical protein
MSTRPLAASLLAVLALGLAACGAEGDDASSGAAARERNRKAELAFARCMREQGIDFPDPSADGKGLVRIGEDTPRQKLEAAEKACARYRAAIEPPQLSEAQQAEFKAAALAHARCMREHGIDFPDPTFAADGAAQIRLSRGQVDMDDPDFKAAEKDCAGKLPQVEEQR